MNQKINVIKNPTLGSNVWIADTARVIGNVSLGNSCSVWFGAVIRGDGDSITIDEQTNIQENAIVHVDPGFPVKIGRQCIIGHGAIVHGATLGNHVLVGMRATILNGAQIGNYCIIGAHALVTEKMIIPDYSVVMGTPAKIIKQLTPEQIIKVEKNATAYVELSQIYLLQRKDLTNDAF
ncbi:MAG: gamma carbonic anhydrase family protein [Bacteroidia bacterium]|jgi:carbonic anhydrase/acetyltransferase-like protein (isoleucine patch superfamily)|nr:gamma carbonic anhydrase family protein [Bacteroidia bacterium]